MKLFELILLLVLIVCAISVACTRDLLTSIVIFMSYSLVMCVIWVLLQSPDLAITEAAVGAGVTTVLFLVTLKKINAIIKKEEEKEKEEEIEEKEEKEEREEKEKKEEKEGRERREGRSSK